MIRDIINHPPKIEYLKFNGMDFMYKKIYYLVLILIPEFKDFDNLNKISKKLKEYCIEPVISSSIDINTYIQQVKYIIHKYDRKYKDLSNIDNWYIMTILNYYIFALAKIIIK